MHDILHALCGIAGPVRIQGKRMMFFNRRRSLSAACVCDIGLRRKNNEDNIYFDGAVLPQEHVGTDGIMLSDMKGINHPAVFAVFDGVGGEADGQVASFMAAERLHGLMAEADPAGIDEKWFRNAFSELNEYVSGEADVRLNNMATTAVLMCIYGKYVYTGNVGDSRAFRLHNGRLEQISKDHTDESVLKACSASNRKPKLMQYIGISLSQFSISPHTAKYKLCAGDVFLICSDGLTDMVQHDDIEGILKKYNSAEKRVEKLKAAAIAGGGRDNITIIVAELR